jgi:hypothetical protein
MKYPHGNILGEKRATFLVVKPAKFPTQIIYLKTK